MRSAIAEVGGVRLFDLDVDPRGRKPRQSLLEEALTIQQLVLAAEDTRASSITRPARMPRAPASNFRPTKSRLRRG